MKLALALLLLLGCVVLYAVADERQKGIDCILQYVDTNKDGCVDYVEIGRALGQCLSGAERLVAPRIETIMHDCDYDKNRCISRLDMERSNATCLRKPDYVRRLLNDFCPRAANGCITKPK